MKYKKKPVEIQAVLYDGSNANEILAFAGDAAREENGTVFIMSGEGERAMKPGDYAVCGVGGEFYASSPESFTSYHERVSGNTYRKKAGNVVEAVEFTGDNFPEIVRLTSFDAARTAKDYNPNSGVCLIPRPGREDYVCSKGDYVIRNGGSVYPCKPDIFAATYEPAE